MEPHSPIEQLDADTRIFFDILSVESNDMACVLLSTAFLDHCLKSLLRKRLVNGDTTKGLLKHTGALGGFEVRAELCYCLGLLPKEMLNNLRALGHMRNDFAHSHLTKTFNDADVAVVVDSLMLPIPLSVAAQVGAPDGLSTPDCWPAHFFTTKRRAFAFIMAMLGRALTVVVANTAPLEKNRNAAVWVRSRPSKPHDANPVVKEPGR